MPQERYSIGREGFIWFIGVVESRNDPDKLGRVRVRCFGWHTDNKEMIPTDSLPWAFITQSPNIPASYTAKEGDMVFGFFLDAESAQNPVVVGVIPGIPIEKPDYAKGFSDPRTSFSDQPTTEPYPLKSKLGEPTLSRLSRNKPTSTIIEKRRKNLKKDIKTARGLSWSEPTPTFSPVYPFNYAHETESGHAFEMDDTPGKERVQLAHKTGTFIEFDSDGNRVEKVIKDNYTVIMGKNNVYIGGRCAVTVEGDCNMKVTGKFTLEAAEINLNASSGKVNVKGGKVSVESENTTNIKAGSSVKVGTEGILSLSGGSTTLAGGDVSIPAAAVMIQEGSASEPEAVEFSLEEVAVTAKKIGTESELVSAIKATVAKVGDAIATVQDTVDAATNVVTGTIGKIQETISKELAPVTEAVNKVTNLMQDVDRIYKDISKKLEPVEKLIGKEIFPRTNFITNAIGELDKFSTKLDKIYDPLIDLNDKVVELNSEIHDKIDKIAEPLNELNYRMHQLNSAFNLSSTDKQIPDLSARLTESLPTNTDIYVDYETLYSLEQIELE